MAKVQVAGGTIKDMPDATTVGEVKQMADAIGFVATLNGEPVNDSAEVGEFDFVALAKPVKAGC